MSTIALPKKIEFEKGKNANEGKIVVEPLFPGYGITLGNSLRRVLLSSLPGAAVVGIKIKGVEHEFTTSPHLKEDILEFILNLKQLRLKVHADETVKLELSVHGQKEIKAGDISQNSQAEIINTDLVLGHITDMAGSLEADIFARRGMGYEMIENREMKNNEIGYIEMDSVYSPILVVGVDVTNVRVSKMTNWDKLTLNLVTDGTITPEEAYKYAVNVLIEQFKALICEKALTNEPSLEKAEELSLEISTPEETSPEAAIEEVKEEKKKKRGRPRKTE